MLHHFNSYKNSAARDVPDLLLLEEGTLAILGINNGGSAKPQNFHD